MAKKKAMKGKAQKNARPAAASPDSPKAIGPVIVKRGAHAEEFDSRKVYASAYFACRNAHLGEQESEKVAEKVADLVEQQAKKEKIILSDKIFHLIVAELKKHSEDASFLFETHRDIS